MSDNYAEESKLLFKQLRTTAFRFIIVQYNHYSLVQNLLEDIQLQFPNKTITKLDTPSTDFESIMNEYKQLNEGVLVLNYFDNILKEETNSLGVETKEMQVLNKQKRTITAGLNLRRDKLAKLNNTLLITIQARSGELIAKKIMEKMPDLWSFRTLFLDLKKEVSNERLQKGIQKNQEVLSRNNNQELTTLGGSTKEDKEAELQQLLTQLNNSTENDIAYKNTLYPQIVEICKDLGKYSLALEYLDEWFLNAAEEGHFKILVKKGDVNMEMGNISKAKENYYTALKLLNQKESKTENEKYDLTKLYSKLGDTQSKLGNIEKALENFEKALKLNKELYISHPENASYKNGLAICYERQGSMQRTLGNVEKAMEYFEKDLELSKELYETHPENANYKNGLAVSYERQGSMQRTLGNVEKAIEYFEKHLVLREELYETHPENVRFKNSLATGYSILGELYEVNLKDKYKANEYYIFSKNIWLELINNFPKNTKFKNNLDWVESRLSNLNKPKI